MTLQVDIYHLRHENGNDLLIENLERIQEARKIRGSLDNALHDLVINLVPGDEHVVSMKYIDEVKPTSVRQSEL